jgi:hypothetical protein
MMSPNNNIFKEDCLHERKPHLTLTVFTMNMASDEKEASYTQNTEKQQVDEEQPAEDAAEDGMDGELAAPSTASIEKDDTDKNHQPAAPLFSR